MSLSGLDLLIPQWQRSAACIGVGVDWFFTDRTAGATWDGKAVCARCPVLAECLAYSVDTNQEHGIWGGAGESLRRHFRSVAKRCPHELGPVVDGCGCDWCISLTQHVGHLSALLLPREQWYHELRRRPPVVVAGPKATHARRGTYAKGCRCDGCTWSSSGRGVDLARLGFDTAVLWREWEAVADRDAMTTRQVADELAPELIGRVVAALCSFTGVPAATVVKVASAAWSPEFAKERRELVESLHPDRWRAAAA